MKTFIVMLCTLVMGCGGAMRSGVNVVAPVSILAYPTLEIMPNLADPNWRPPVSEAKDAVRILHSALQKELGQEKKKWKIAGDWIAVLLLSENLEQIEVRVMKRDEYRNGKTRRSKNKTLCTLSTKDPFLKEAAFSVAQLVLEKIGKLKEESAIASPPRQDRAGR